MIRLIRIKDRPAAKAPPARSFAQLPPIARAKRMWRFPITPQPICSRTPPVVTKKPSSGLIIAMVLPRLIIRPAAGITAMTTINALPNFCQNSKLNRLLNDCLFIIRPPYKIEMPAIRENVCIFHLLLYHFFSFCKALTCKFLIHKHYIQRPWKYCNPGKRLLLSQDFKKIFLKNFSFFLFDKQKNPFEISHQRDCCYSCIW